MTITALPNIGLLRSINGTEVGTGKLYMTRFLGHELPKPQIINTIHLYRYRGISLIRNRTHQGPYSRPMLGPYDVPRDVAISYERGTPELCFSYPIWLSDVSRPSANRLSWKKTHVTRVVSPGHVRETGNGKRTPLKNPGKWDIPGILLGNFNLWKRKTFHGRCLGNASKCLSVPNWCDVPPPMSWRRTLRPERKQGFPADPFFGRARCSPTGLTRTEGHTI